MVDKQDLEMLKEKLLAAGFEVLYEGEESAARLHMSYEYEDQSYLDVWLHFSGDISLMLFKYVGKDKGGYGVDYDYDLVNDKNFDNIKDLLDYLEV